MMYILMYHVNLEFKRDKGQIRMGLIIINDG